MSKKNQKKLKVVFWLLLGIFIVLVSYFAIPFPDHIIRTTFLIVGVLGLIFLLLGITLIFLTIKQKIKGKLKIFLILVGVSAISPLVFSILHNLFYALAIIGKNIPIIKYIMEILHVASFIIALVVSPIGFLVGAIGVIVLFIRKKGRHSPRKTG